MAIESGLPQPGVQVIQQFRTVSPTIVAPTLVPCSVAPAFQVLEAMTQDSGGSDVINQEAVASIAAILVGSIAGPFAGLDGLTLEVSVDNGPVQEFTLADPETLGLSVQQIIDQLNSSFPAPSGFVAFDKLVGSSHYLGFRTVAKGDGHYLKVGTGTAQELVGLPLNYIVEGVTSYKQERIGITTSELPDPRSNMDELSVVTDTIRAFVNTGRALKEMKRDETFLRGGTTAILTGTTITFPLDLTSATTLAYSETVPMVTPTNVLFPASRNDASAATCSFAIASTTVTLTDTAAPFTAADVGRRVSIADATTPGNNGDFVILTVSTNGQQVTYTNATGATEAFATGGTPTTWTVAPIFAAIGALVANLNAQGLTTKWSSSANALVYTTTTGKLTISTAPTGLHLPTETSGLLPVASAIIAVDDGSSGTTTPLVDVLSDNFTTAGNVATLQGTVEITTLSGQEGKTFQVSVDGGPMQELVCPSGTLSHADILNWINDTLGAGTASWSGNYLVLTSHLSGNDGEIHIGVGTINSALGFTDSDVEYGVAFPPMPGDYVYGGGSFLGIVVTAAYGSNTHRIKLDRKISKDYWAASFYIEAKGIPSDLPATRPLPDLIVANQNITLKQNFLRDITGAVITSGRGQLVLSYKALRLDVSSAAANPGLITVDSTDTLETVLSPVNADNPLALMMYYSLVNAPGIEVSGIGVDEISDNEPEGSADGYSRALSFLEAKEVYALAPGTQSALVHQAFMTHVAAMSEPDARGERIVFICPEMPSENLPALVTSGTNGESAASTNVFESNLPSLSADMVAADLSPDQPLTYADGVFITVEGYAQRWNVASVSGTQITLRVSFSAGQNTDGFFTTDTLPGDLLQKTFAMYVRGASLVVPGTEDPDYSAIAAAYAALGSSYGSRRVYMVAPEKVSSVVDGIEQELPGYYLCAALAGMVGQLAPQQGFTNYPITGFTRPIGSNDVFSRLQMNNAAAGGTYWVIQNAAGAPLTTRHQLSTNLTSIESRELSITKVIDFMAKMLRAGLRNFIGRFNITQPFLDTLSTVVQGMLNFGVEQGVIVGGDLNNIIQSSDQPDTVLIDVTLDPPYPCNYIRLTLVI